MRDLYNRKTITTFMRKNLFSEYVEVNISQLN